MKPHQDCVPYLTFFYCAMVFNLPVGPLVLSSESKCDAKQYYPLGEVYDKALFP